MHVPIPTRQQEMRDDVPNVSDGDQESCLQPGSLRPVVEESWDLGEGGHRDPLVIRP